MKKSLLLLISTLTAKQSDEKRCHSFKTLHNKNSKLKPMIQAILDLFQNNYAVSIDEFLPFAGYQIHEFCHQEIFFDFECFNLSRTGNFASLWAIWDINGNNVISNEEYGVVRESMDLNGDG